MGRGKEEENIFKRERERERDREIRERERNQSEREAEKGEKWMKGIFTKPAENFVC